MTVYDAPIELTIKGKVFFPVKQEEEYNEVIGTNLLTRLYHIENYSVTLAYTQDFMVHEICVFMYVSSGIKQIKGTRGNSIIRDGAIPFAELSKYVEQAITDPQNYSPYYDGPYSGYVSNRPSDQDYRSAVESVYGESSLTVTIKGDKCVCGLIPDSGTGVRFPQEGDIGICSNCAAIQIVKDGVLRTATAEEIEELKASSDYSTIEQLQQQLKLKKAKSAWQRK